MPTVRTEREIAFDIAKGIAAYLVVLGHFLGQVAGKNIMLITFCHMPVFFWISGFFLNRTLRKTGGVIGALLSSGYAGY